MTGLTNLQDNVLKRLLTWSSSEMTLGQYWRAAGTVVGFRWGPALSYPCVSQHHCSPCSPGHTPPSEGPAWITREVVSILHTMDWTESNLAKAERCSSRLLRTKPFLRTSSKGNRQQGHFQKCVLIIAVLPASQESHCWPRANREKKVL